MLLKNEQEPYKINKRNKVAFLIRKLSNTWIMNSGTTTYMTNDAKDMSDISEINSIVDAAKENGTMREKAVGNLEFTKWFIEKIDGSRTKH